MGGSFRSGVRTFGLVRIFRIADEDIWAVVLAGVKIRGEENARAAPACMLAAWFLLLSQVASCLLVFNMPQIKSNMVSKKFQIVSGGSILKAQDGLRGAQKSAKVTQGRPKWSRLVARDAPRTPKATPKWSQWRLRGEPRCLNAFQNVPQTVPNYSQKIFREQQKET